MEDGLRADLLLHRLCLTKSRSQAKAACEAGAVLVDGSPARASQVIRVGETVTLRFPRRTLELVLEEVPGKSTSRKAAREMYRVVRDDEATEEIIG